MDAHKAPASQAQIAAREPISLRRQFADHVSRGSEWILDNKTILGPIETMSSLSDRVAAATGLEGNSRATF